MRIPHGVLDANADSSMHCINKFIENCMNDPFDNKGPIHSMIIANEPMIPLPFFGSLHADTRSIHVNEQ